jgi:putative transcriptional regulator
VNQSDFESFQRGMEQAHAYLEGAREGYVIHEPVDVRRVRARTKLTRKLFASRYGLDTRTVEQWEQGRRKPDKSSETYLRLIENEPEKMAELVLSLHP